jgi:hypothetical protein
MLLLELRATRCSGALLLLLGALARLGERRVFVTLRLLQVGLAPIFGLVQGAGVVGALVGQRLVEVRASRRELRLQRGDVGRELGSELGELLVLCLTVDLLLLET